MWFMSLRQLLSCYRSAISNTLSVSMVKVVVFSVMTPFHHHLELGGLSGKGDKWSEWKVDAFLWTVGALASAITLWMVLGNVMK